MNRLATLPGCFLFYTQLYEMTTHAIHIYCLWRVPSTPACYWGTLRLLRARFGGFIFPVRYGSVGVQLTRLRDLGHSYFRMCLEKSKLSCLRKQVYIAAILARLIFIRVFEGMLLYELVVQEQKNTNGNQQKTRLEASKPPTV